MTNSRLLGLILLVVISRNCSVLANDRGIAELVRQLGDQSFERRISAEKELLKKGYPSLDFVEAGVESSDPEIRQRSIRLRGILRKSYLTADRDRIRENPWIYPEEMTPGWQLFQEIAGDGPAARDAYVRMLDSEGDLMLSLVIQPESWTEEFERRCVDLRGITETRSARNLDPYSVLALMFLAEHPTNVRNSNSVNIVQSMLLDQSFMNGIQRLNEDEFGVFQSFLSDWVVQARQIPSAGRLELASRFQLAAGVEPAREIIALQRAAGVPQPHAQINAIRFIINYGEIDSLELLEELVAFPDVSLELTPLELEQAPPKANPGPRGQEHAVNDVALLGMVMLTGQNPIEYNFTNIRVEKRQLVNVGNPLFQSDELRRQAIERWRSWKESHPQIFRAPSLDAVEGWAT
ncbi:hypothetical protein SH668x_000338 [Planctomicrobium sp. SH668]|uniref:hypothetical protein n=1 Tax=Planctomicrobium sp. SH668 TaxID=3448126 RepID=UPI003F5B3B81